jgi:hypothetical protein
MGTRYLEPIQLEEIASHLNNNHPILERRKKQREKKRKRKRKQLGITLSLVY